MRTKIQNSFHELPPDSHASLRDSLLEHVNAVNEETNSVIVTQLCLAIADLALLMGPQGWPQAVRDLTTRYSKKIFNIYSRCDSYSILASRRSILFVS